MLSSEGKRVRLIEEWRFRGVLILMSKDSLLGIWRLVWEDIIP